MKGVAIIANPSAGKDIRRLVASGRVISNQEKANIITRFVKGLAYKGVRNIYFMPDKSGLFRPCIDELKNDIEVNFLDTKHFDGPQQTLYASKLIKELDCACVLVLGGDGTNRLVAKEVGNVPIIPISTGTNNAFPIMIDPTVAGLAAGFYVNSLQGSNNKELIFQRPIITISIDDKKMFKKEINGLNIDMLDSPVSGTGAQAWEADLTVFASGSKELIDKCMNIFKAFSKEVIDVGSFGNGMKFKILANLLVTIHNTAAAEALRLGELAGLDQDMIYKVLGNSAATSVMLQKRMPLMINKNYEPPTASFNIFLKDVDIIRNFIKNNNVTLPTFEGSAKIYDKAEKTLSKNWDTASVYEVLKMENIDE